MITNELSVLTLENLGHGAAAEKFAEALSKVIENICDPNTDYKARRAITIQVSFIPSEQRNSAKVLIDVKTKLAEPTAWETQVYVGLEDGIYVATEFNPKQMLLFDPPKPNVRPIKQEENGQEG